MEIGEYCLIWLPDNLRSDNLGFILGKRETTGRGKLTEYLIAHQFDVEWLTFSVRPIDAETDTAKDLAYPNCVATDWRDMPESWTEPILKGSDRSYGWEYIGPKYGSKQ